MTFVSINAWDYMMMLISAYMLYLVVMTFKRDKFDRVEGFIFLAVYIGYMVYLVLR